MSFVFDMLDRLFGGADEPVPAPAAPVLKPVTPMPLPDEDAIKRAKRRSIAGQMQRSGRQSTLLTSDPVTGQTLG